MANFVTIGTFTSPLDAHLARGRLEAEGIPSFVAHENHVWAGWMYSHALGGVKLQVLTENSEEAQGILKSHIGGEFEPALRAEFPDITDNKCPACGSKNFKSRFTLTAVILVILTLGTLGIIFPLHRENHQCLNCKTKWK